MLNFDTFVLTDRMNDQRTNYGAEDKNSSVQQIHVLTVITFLVRKNWTHPPSASESYGRLAGWQAGRKIQVDCAL